MDTCKTRLFASKFEFKTLKLDYDLKGKML